MVARETCARAAIAPIEARWKSPVREITARAASSTASRRRSASREDTFAATSGTVLVETDMAAGVPVIRAGCGVKRLRPTGVSPVSAGGNDALTLQVGDDLVRARLDALSAGVDGELWVERRLVRGRDACELLDLARACFLVETLHVALLADLD